MSCFVIIVINHDILERLVVGYMVALLEVDEAVLVVLPSFGLITLQSLINSYSKLTPNSS
jgi:hypothetical protein